MNKQTQILDTKEMKKITPEVSLEKPIKDLFDECLSFISSASFEN